MERPSRLVPAIFDEAVGHHKAGRLDEANSLYQKILALDCHHADALHLRGVIALQKGRPDLAVDLIGKAITIDDKSATYHSNLGNALCYLDRTAEAIASYRRAIDLKPDSAEAYNNLGNALRGVGRQDEAVAAYRTAISLQPAYGAAYGNLGGVLSDLGRPAEAAFSYHHAIALNPDDAQAYNNLGIALQSLERPEDAVAAYRRAVGLQSGYVHALNNLGNILQLLGRTGEAARFCRQALDFDPACAEARNNLGNALKDLGRLDEAIASYRRAVEGRPDYAEAYNNLGSALQMSGQPREAAVCFRKALGLRPDDAEALAEMGRALQDLGFPDTAKESYRRALCLKPDLSETHSNLMMSLHYGTAADEREILEEARRFASRVEGRHSPRDFTNTAEPERRLRIGYVSGDFCRHPVGYFLSGVLASHDPASVETFCYSNSATTDDMTQRLRAAADHWRSVVGLADEVAVAQIVADGIDILVDLSGHTGGNRLPMFARKTAPVQISWLGYWGTTGLSTMDYLLTDAVTVPAGEERWYSEEVLRLPGSRFCYAAPDYAPPPASDPPMRRRGYVTFGSFNNLTKVGPEVVSLWAALLRSLPGACLLLKWKSLADTGVARQLTAAFAGAGIEESRLELRAASLHAAMLAEYDDIDIALDPFPFSGGLTSCEALWMGVPVVTLPGDTAPSRQTLGFLQALGLTEWAAATPADYMRIASGLAADGDRLGALRRGLRRRLAASPLCDGPGFTRGLERTYRDIWRRWCQARG
ncbi:tetratricopeptide repeat protein [Telmatospirillum sp.]|uniref:tetratricopeptide repeat protein n=1 Tax=Telmatospirillum sp. TaxID=2079197 RepID=UPI00284D5A3E|nr:tetratricopeptide repeat protein [Telmatospirillum sp.]MDR3439572.1 tetratricopeptide repeat protein [Telmatospirillum sp.]